MGCGGETVSYIIVHVHLKGRATEGKPPAVDQYEGHKEYENVGQAGYF